MWRRGITATDWALRGAGHLMENSEQEKKLLLVLTDGSPQDDRIAAEGAFYKNREYTDQIAVEDTTEQVQHLKRKGIQVVGVFMGTERGLQTAHRIFGRDFVRIENIQQFSEVVGKDPAGENQGDHLTNPVYCANV